MQSTKAVGFGAYVTGVITSDRYLESLAELAIQLPCVQSHGGELGFTFSPVA